MNSEKALEDREVWDLLELYEFNPQSAFHITYNLCRLEASAYTLTYEIEELLVKKGIPFNRDTEATYEANESHALYRPDEAPKKFEYVSNEVTVPANVLWDIAESLNSDIKQNLLAFLEEYAPRLESLGQSAEKWEKRQTGR